MAGPKQKYFGSLSLSGIKKAVTEIPSKVGEYKGDKQLKVNAAMWDDGNISLSIWDGEKKEDIKIGNLRISTLDAPKVAESKDDSKDDLPF